MNDIQINQMHVNAWNYLLMRIPNVNAVAGIMGYFQAKTGFNIKLGFEPGKILEKDSFVYDKKAYGIGAWSKWNEKLSWWNLAKISGFAVESLESQLDLFCDQLKGTTFKALNDGLEVAENPENAGLLMHGLYFSGDESSTKLKNDILEYAHLFHANFVHPKRKVRYVEIKDEEVWARFRPTFLGKKVHKANKGETYQYIATTKNGRWFSIYLDGKILWVKAESAVVFEREETYGVCSNNNCV